MAVLDSGKVQQLGRPQDVYLRPKNKFVASFIGETNFVSATIKEISDSRAVLETSIGELHSAVAPENLSVGDAVTLSIRPEAVMLNNPPADAPNVFPGKVHNTIYLGEMAQHVVDLPGEGDGKGWKVFDLNPRIVARDGVEEAQVWVDPVDVVVLES